jgi:hypothetical protein
MNHNKLFIAIGPPKTATGWLYKTLKEHPDVFLPPDKEIRYFWVKEFLGKSNFIRKLFGKHWHYKEKRRYLKYRIKHHFSTLVSGRVNFHDIWWDFRYFFFTENDSWYCNLFDKNRLSGDITPKYSELSEKSIEEIRALYPHAKIIISLRSPIDREWSRAKMNLMKKKGIDDYSKIDASQFKDEFMDDLQHKANDYVSLVKRWKKHFSENNVFVFFYEELLDNPHKLINDVCDFLNIKQLEFRTAAAKVNPGIKQEIPVHFKKLLIDLNYPFMIKMPEYFKSKYPEQWLKECENMLRKEP